MVGMESTIMLNVGQIADFSIRKYMHSRKILNNIYFFKYNNTCIAELFCNAFFSFT